MVYFRDWKGEFLNWYVEHEAGCCSVIFGLAGAAGLWWASVNPGLNVNRFFGAGAGFVGGALGFGCAVVGVKEDERGHIKADTDDVCFDVVQVAEAAAWEQQFLAPQPVPVQYLPAGGEGEGIDFYDPKDIPSEACGILFGGNSGSGKTSLGAGHVVGLLTQDRPAEIIVLDIHASRNPIWREMGFPRVEDDAETIFNISQWFIREIEDRKSRPDTHPIIVCIDEINDTLSELEYLDQVKPLDGKQKRVKLFSYAIRKLGNARKFDIVMAGFMQSHNTDAIGIDAKFRNNFLLVLTGASARAEGDVKLKHASAENQWLNSVAYPCAVSGSAPFQLMEHATHGHHEIYRKKGNAPANLIAPNFLEVETVPRTFGEMPGDWEDIEDDGEPEDLEDSRGTKAPAPATNYPGSIVLRKPKPDPKYPSLSKEQIRILHFVLKESGRARLGDVMRSITIQNQGERWTKDNFLHALNWMEEKGYVLTREEGNVLWIEVRDRAPEGDES